MPKVNQDTRYCPHCGADWRSAPIPEEHRKHYGSHTHFSRLIGVEVPALYDGISFWRCPDCGTEWDRFTGQVADATGTP